MLTDEERRQLLTIARNAVARGERTVPSRVHVTGLLARPGGAFVTIRLRGDLRGCIGYIESPQPLATVVAEVAHKSATQDPRFPPLTAQEIEEAVIEVSVLSPLQRVKETGDIRVGVHGLLIELGPRRGLLLPQVAGEYGWDTAEFLENTCRKAGLASGSWKVPGAKLYMFTAEVCVEEHAHT